MRRFIALFGIARCDIRNSLPFVAKPCSLRIDLNGRSIAIEIDGRGSIEMHTIGRYIVEHAILFALEHVLFAEIRVTRRLELSEFTHRLYVPFDRFIENV